MAEMRIVNNESAVSQKVADFDTFWQFAPRKGCKALARAKYEAIVQGGLDTKILDRDSGQFIPVHLEATAAELIRAIRYYAYKMQGTEERYIKHASTWLNRGSWQEYDPTEIEAWEKRQAEEQQKVAANLAWREKMKATYR